VSSVLVEQLSFVTYFTDLAIFLFSPEENLKSIGRKSEIIVKNYRFSGLKPTFLGAIVPDEDRAILTAPRFFLLKIIPFLTHSNILRLMVDIASLCEMGKSSWAQVSELGYSRLPPPRLA